MASTTSNYRSLSGTEVRFLKLHLSSWDEPIKCEMLYRPMTELPTYIALSYAWGNSSDPQEISVDGHPVSITINLFEAMQQMRAFLVNPSKAPEVFKNENVVFWIDAICINQADIVEKTKQVPRMGKIFSCAELVLAWLGQNGVYDDMVAKIMEMAKRYVKISDVPVEIVEAELMDPLSDEGRVQLFKAFENLFKRSWFRRVWVIQEVALAGKTPVFLAGACWSTLDGFTFLWHECRQSSKYLYMIEPLRKAWFAIHLNNYITLRIDLGLWWTGLAALYDSDSSDDSNPTKRTSLGVEQSTVGRNAHDISKYGENLSFHESYYNLLESTFPGDTETARIHTLAYILSQILQGLPGYIDATIPHNYIYGILSMAKCSRIPEFLAPNYSIPFSKVFHTYTQVILEHTGDLSFISRKENHLTGVPTWVPDFRYARPEKEPMGTKWALLAIDTGVRILNNGNTCSAQGVRLGDIVLTHHCLLNPVNSITFTHEVLNCIRFLDAFLEEVSLFRGTEKKAIVAAVLSRLFRRGRGSHDQRSE